MTSDLMQRLADANPVLADALPEGSSPVAQQLLASRVLPTRTALRRRRHHVILASVTGAAVALGGTAAAYSALTSDDVQTGLPASSAAFIGADPRCAQSDAETFRCNLARTPVHEYAADWSGAKETFTDSDGNIAGGCVSVAADGRSWICYLGQRAVREHVLDSAALGQHQDGPHHG